MFRKSNIRPGRGVLAVIAVGVLVGSLAAPAAFASSEEEASSSSTQSTEEIVTDILDDQASESDESQNDDGEDSSDDAKAPASPSESDESQNDETEKEDSESSDDSGDDHQPNAPPSDDGKDKGKDDSGDEKDPKDEPKDNGNPPGNNGTIKVDGEEFDNHPDNEPHVGCVFQVDWYNFDEGDDIFSTVTFEDQAPTADGGLTVVSGDLHPFVGEDPAGGGTDLDASVTYKLAFTGDPHPIQGYHVKLTVNTPGSIGADVKHKVFWVEGCEPDRPEPPAPKKHYEKQPGCDLSQYGDFEPGVIARVGYESWVWVPEKKKYVLSGEIEWKDWFQKKVWTIKEQIKYGCFEPMPSIDIEKYSSYDGPEAGDFDETAKGLDPTADTPISLIVTNTGNVPLVDVDVSDETTAGVGTLTGLTCDFSKLGGPATGTTWSGPFLVDDAFPCTGTLPALGYDATHTDVAKVTAKGKYSETSVSDNDPWNGSTPPKGQVVITEFVPEDPCNRGDVTDNVRWTTELPENSDLVTYTEDGRDRTQTLVDAEFNTWTDGTTEPIVSTLPEDSGELCPVKIPPPNTPVKNPPANPPAPHNPGPTPTEYEPGHPGGMGVVPAAQVTVSPFANPLIRAGAAAMLLAAAGGLVVWFRRRAAA